MPALKIDMTIPIGGAGHVRLDVAITDTGALTDGQRAAIADTASEFCAFAAATLTTGTVAQPAVPAAVHDPDASVLNGVRGSRIRADL